MRMKVWSMAAAVLLLAGCGGPKPEIPQGVQKTGSPPDTSNVKINGDASDPVNKIVVQAISDLEKFWGEQFPEVYGKDFEPISGGYYAVYPSTDDPPPIGNGVASSQRVSPASDQIAVVLA